MAGTLDYYLDMLEKIQELVNCANGPIFPDSLALHKITGQCWSDSMDTPLEGAQMIFLPKSMGYYSFDTGRNLSGHNSIFLHGGINDHILQRDGEFRKCIFQ